MTVERARARRPESVPDTRRLVGGVALALFVSAMVRGFGVILLEELQSTSWRPQSGLVVALALLCYGLASPFAAALGARIGLKCLVIIALATLSLSSTAAAFATQWWILALVWGIGGGLATGALSTTLVANVVAQYDVGRRGLVSGTLVAINAAGALISLPLLSLLASAGGWQLTTSVIGIVAAISLIVFALLLDSSALPGVGVGKPSPQAVAVLRVVARSRAFWLLGGAFAVCGATTAGVIGAHLIPAAEDRGLDPWTGAVVLAAIGALDIVGTLISGWLADRVNELLLLAILFVMRSAALLTLPFVLAPRLGAGFVVVIVVLGLDWVAVTPPTIRLVVEHFGSERSAVVFGWLAILHQLGAAAAAASAGLTRGHVGTYAPVFVVAAVLCLGQGLVFLAVSARGRHAESTRNVAPRPLPT